MRNIISAILFIAVLFAFVQPADAYVSVKGYYRSIGTYVQPHVRSNPNGLKYDNYGYRPSQGLYNKSYSGGSSYWKTDNFERKGADFTK